MTNNRRKTLAMFAVIVTALGCASRSQTGGTSEPPLPAAPDSIVEMPVTLATPGGNVFGTLELPASRYPVPVALIIAGSGPTDRNGNSPALPGANNSLKLLSRGLAEHGIASLRYDKRGIAASRQASTREQDVRFTHFIEDAEGWLAQLRADRRFSTVAVVGHSEGSLIGMVAAGEAGADAYVSLEGAGRKPLELISEQLSGQLPPETVAQARAVMATMEAGNLPDSSVHIPPILASLFRPSVQPYLVSWFKYDPAVEIAKLRIPVLIVQGTTDIQVGMKDADTLAAAQPAGKLVVIEGMNHVLKTAPPGRAEQMATYSDPTLPVVPRLLGELAGFIHGARKKAR